MVRSNTNPGLATALLASVLLACGGSDGGQDDDEIGGTEAATDGEDGTHGPGDDGPDDGPDDGRDEGADETTGGELDPDGPRVGAIDIALDSVTLNQGVEVTLADGGVVLDVLARGIPVIHGRRTRVEARYTLAPGFEPRDIRAELRVAQPGGIEDVFADERLVGVPGEFDPKFEWELEAEAIPEGSQWSISLHELELSPDGAPDPAAPRLPAAGTAVLDDAPGEQRITITFVPIRHQLGRCDQVSPHDEARIQALRETMEEHYPVQAVEITVHDEVVFTQSTATLDTLIQAIVDLRWAEAPPGDVYYYGSVWPCVTPNVAGLGVTLPDPTTPFGEGRASVGVYDDDFPTREAIIMVHEVGHNHGRQHVACNGDEGTIDPAYPIPGGEIGVEGWGVHDGQLRPPSAKDYMSYCQDRWVSPYGWQQTLAVIDGLRDNLAMAAPGARADGPQDWRLLTTP